MQEYFKNKPRQNPWLGLVTGLFLAFTIAAIVTGLEIFDRATSIVGLNSDNKEKDIPFLCVMVVLAVFFFLLRQKMKRNVYNQIEELLDD